MAISDFFDIKEETFEDKIKMFTDHMDELMSMDVREQTLYKKHTEIQTHYRSYHNRVAISKAKIWTPSDISDLDRTVDEIRNLQPRLRYIERDDRSGIDLWTTLRVFVSSAEFDQNPGRFLRFFLEAQDGRVLGIISLSSDVMNLGPRDKLIGWTPEQKQDKGMLKHTAIGTCIVPMQPFGYNFLGGKLLTSMLATQYVRDIWKREYNDELVAITTTSLYGDGSMYNGIKWWKSLGETTGRIGLKPNDDVYQIMLEQVKRNRYDEYKSVLKNEAGGPGSGVKQKIIHLILKECNIPSTRYQHGFKRGIYFCQLYNNTPEFLRQEIQADQLVLKDILRRDTADIMDWWTPKSINRYTKLHTEGKLKPEKLLYSDAIFLPWDEFKQKYLHNVGR